MEDGQSDSTFNCSTETEVAFVMFEKEDELLEVEVDDYITRRAKTKFSRLLEPKDIGVENCMLVSFIPAELRPEEIPDDVDIPNVIQPPEIALRVLSEFMGVKDSDTSLTSFWVMDTLSGVLYECQSMGMSQKGQKMIMVWIVYILKQIFVFDYTREEMFQLLDKLWTNAEGWIKNKNLTVLPHPRDVQSPPPLLTIDISSSILSTTELTPALSADAPKKGTNKVLPNMRSSIYRKSYSQFSKPSVQVPLKKKGLGKSDQADELPPIKLPAPCKYQEALTQLLSLIKFIYKIMGNKFVYEVIRQNMRDPACYTTVDILQEGFYVPKEGQQPQSHSPVSPKKGKSLINKKLLREKASEMGKKTNVGFKKTKSEKSKRLGFLVQDHKNLEEEFRAKLEASRLTLLPLTEAVTESYMENIYKKTMADRAAAIARSKLMTQARRQKSMSERSSIME